MPYQLAEALGRAGHRVDYLAVAPGNSRRDLQHARAFYVSTDPGSPVFPNSLLFPLYQYRRTFGKMKDYDIIHSDAHDAAFYALHRLIFGAPPRLVTTLHTSAIPRFVWQRRSPFELYLFLALRLADLVICPSNYSRVNVSQAYGVAVLKTRALHGGVPSSFFAQEPRGEGEGPFTLLFCGRLNGRKPFKTVDVLLKAMPQVLRKHTAELNIIGTGPRVEEYAALARTMGIEEEVRFLGFVEHDKLPAYYGASDLLVLPSRMESFGLVLVEAMACALPVVATRVGGIPEVVEEGVTGILVEPNDPQALAEAIIEMLDEPDRMRAMGARGRERVREHFTWDRAAERVEEAYQEIL